MTALELFERYLAEVEGRLRWRALARGVLALAIAALLATLLLALWADRTAFSATVLYASRVVLFVILGLAAALAVAVPLTRLNRRSAAEEAERASPEFAQRAITISSSQTADAFTELVARQALEQTLAAPADSLVRPAVLTALLASSAVAIGVLVWLTVAAPGALGHGARLVWTGAPKAGQGALYQILVKPGDARVRRGGDQVVEATLTGFESRSVTLRARKQGAAQWEELPMEPRPGASGFAFLFAGLTGDVDYQVEAGRLRSPVHRLSVVDTPAVKKLRITYRYPAALGLPVSVDDPGGDIRAVEGTEATVEVLTDRRLTGGALILDDGSRLELAPSSGLWLKAVLPVRKDGVYYVAALDQGSPVRLSEDYFIEVRAEKPPDVRIARPGRDARVSPIEEVTVEVEASDDFGLKALELKYSVNGGPEQSAALSGKRGAKDAQQTATLALEDFKLVPGDVVTLYAKVGDARAISQSDILFLEAQPFEKEYSQSQTSGGEGGGQGGGEQQAQIAQRQKEIIAATWNQVKRPKPRDQAREDAAVLSAVEQKLAEQARSLAARMRSRELSAANEEFQKFSREMEAAAQAMTEATGQIKAARWREALAPEQRALQHLLRAESVFRQIQVAFGQRGGGGGGGQMRDLESLFDLELDTEKNQYETAQSGSSGESSRERQVDEALRKLEELARRQQAAAARNQNSQPNFQQRWAQEMLRREAEQLRRQMEQAEQNGQQQGQQQSQQQGQQSGASSSDGAGGQQRLSRARQQLERAIEDMRRAQSQPGQQGSESARRAAERMSEARDSLSAMRRQQSGEQLSDLAQRASDLARRQRQYEEEVRRNFPAVQPQQLQPQQRQTQQAAAETMARDKESMEREYRSLEQSMKEAARSLEGSSRPASGRLREALGEAQQNELGLRMKLGSDWVRRGLGPYLAPRERVVTEALDQLSRQVEEARQMGAQGGAGDESRQRTEQALGRIEQLRQNLQNQARAQGQPGGQRAGQQPGGQRPGQQPGGRGQSFLRGDYGALNDGTRSFDGGAGSLEQSYEETVRQLRGMRLDQATSDESRQELDRLLAEMQRADPKRFAGNAALLGRIESEVLPRLEQLELRLRRELDAAASGATRTGAAPKAPPGYAESVADYFRRLSRGR